MPASLQPYSIRSKDRRLEVTLDLDYATFDIGRESVRLRSYNQRLVGPVLRVKAGDTLAITLYNRLLMDPPVGRRVNGQYDWNTTNLHFHGLHVAPQGARDPELGTIGGESDNLLLEVRPSTWPGKPFDPAVSLQRFEVRIPPDHPAGTFWYHACKHGAMAAQVSSGLVGALIVERDDETTNLDSIPEIANAAEEVAVIQQIPYLSKVLNGVGGIEAMAQGDSGHMFGPGAWHRLHRYTLVNGERIPTITVSPGEVRRFRFIHAGAREPVSLTLVPSSGATLAGPSPDLFEIALDGFATGLLDAKSRVDLYPGCRSDVLLRVPAAASGEFLLVDGAHPDMRATGADGSPEPVCWIAKLVVQGPKVDMALPTEAQLVRQRLPTITVPSGGRSQYLVFGADGAGEHASTTVTALDAAVAASSGRVERRTFGGSLPRVVELGKTDRWIVGASQMNGGIEGSAARCSHVFHMPVNSFLVTRVFRDENGGLVDVSATELRVPIWRDTLPMKDGYAYELAVHYRDFVGTTASYCQVLDNADDGMMDLMAIVDPRYVGAPDTKGTYFNRISAVIPPARGVPVVLLFVKGASCWHCMAQLNEMANRLAGRGLDISVISASTLQDLQGFPRVPFTLVADPAHVLFRAYGAMKGAPQHATIVFDANGVEVFRNVGFGPLLDASPVLRALGMDGSFSR